MIRKKNVKLYNKDYATASKDIVFLRVCGFASPYDIETYTFTNI